VAGAKEVYGFLDVASRFEYVPLTCGHQATSPEIDAAWQRFFSHWLLGFNNANLRENPSRFYDRHRILRLRLVGGEAVID